MSTHSHEYTQKKRGRKEMLRVNEIECGNNFNEMAKVRQGAPVDVQPILMYCVCNETSIDCNVYVRRKSHNNYYTFM